MTLPLIEKYARLHGLFVMGACHPKDADGTLVLIGAAADFWPIFQRSDEFNNNRPDPIDCFSKRIIGGIAGELGASASFPSDGPPYAPFIDWALQTGRFYSSPVGMLVHDIAGLMISIRGALHFQKNLTLPTAVRANPCAGCAMPCRTACPVDALQGDRYNVAACKSHLHGDAGQGCMAMGCAARRACPVSQSFGRPPEQSAFHMKAFL